MLSSLTPTILARDGELFMVTGTPGGRTIINTVLQTILNVVDHGMSAQTAVDAGRIHHRSRSGDRSHGGCVLPGHVQPGHRPRHANRHMAHVMAAKTVLPVFQPHFRMRSGGADLTKVVGNGLVRLGNG